MANQIVSPFILPNEYERKIAEAKRREAMAKMLAQQQYQPLEGSAAPTPSYAPLVQGLQSYLLARELKKGQEAKDAATELEGQSARQISGRLQGGRVSEPTPTGMESQPVKDFYQMRGQMAEPILQEEYQRIEAEKNAPMPKNPTVDDLQPVIPTAQYTRSPRDALGVASTAVGQAALQNRPFLGAQLAEALKAPKFTDPKPERIFNPTTGLYEYRMVMRNEETGEPKLLDKLGEEPETANQKQTREQNQKQFEQELELKIANFSVNQQAEIRQQMRNQFDTGITPTIVAQNLNKRFGLGMYSNPQNNPSSTDAGNGRTAPMPDVYGNKPTTGVTNTTPLVPPQPPVNTTNQPVGTNTKTTTELPWIDPNSSHWKGLPAKDKVAGIAKFKEDQLLAEKNSIGSLDRNNNVINRIQDLINNKSLDKIAGPIAQYTGLFNTETQAARNTLYSLGSASALAELVKLRESSKTGGAVGNVTEAEWGRLSDAAAALGQAVDGKELRRNLGNYKNALQTIQNRLKTDHVRVYGEELNYTPPPYTPYVDPSESSRATADAIIDGTG